MIARSNAASKSWIGWKHVLIRWQERVPIGPPLIRGHDEAGKNPRHCNSWIVTRRDIVDGKVRTSKTTYRRIIATSGVDGRRSSFGAPPFHNATAFYHIHVLYTFARSLECVAEVPSACRRSLKRMLTYQKQVEHRTWARSRPTAERTRRTAADQIRVASTRRGGTAKESRHSMRRWRPVCQASRIHKQSAYEYAVARAEIRQANA